MTPARRILALVLLAAIPGLARAAVDCTAREPNLPHICDKGPNAGQPCVPDFSTVTDPLTCSVSRPAENNACLGAKCTMVFEKGGQGGIQEIALATRIPWADEQAFWSHDGLSLIHI